MRRIKSSPIVHFLSLWHLLSAWHFLNLWRARLWLPALSLVISACTSAPQVVQDDWPADIPTRAYFHQVYEQDKANMAIQTEEEYLTWVVRFYHGWELYRRGWNRMTDELLVEIHDPVQAADAKLKTEHLGMMIAGEWAKKVDERTIFTRHVAIWGNALLESIDRGNAVDLINRVSADVAQLLAHKIQPDLITAGRYFPQDASDPFL